MHADEDSSNEGKEGKGLPDMPLDTKGSFDPGKTQIRERVADMGKASIDTLEQALALEREKRQAAEEELAHIKESEVTGLADAKRMLGEARETISTYNAILQSFKYDTLGAKGTPEKLKEALELSGKAAALVGNTTLCSPAIKKLEEKVKAAEELKKTLESMGGPAGSVPSVEYQKVVAENLNLAEKLSALGVSNSKLRKDYDALLPKVNETYNSLIETKALLEELKRREAVEIQNAVTYALGEAKHEHERDIDKNYVAKADYAEACKARDEAVQKASETGQALGRAGMEINFLKARLDNLIGVLQSAGAELPDANELMKKVTEINTAAKELYVSAKAGVDARSR